MKVNDYRVLQYCIEKGVASGWYRAHKHSDAPDEEAIKVAIEMAVINEISEYFQFEGGSDEAEN